MIYLCLVKLSEASEGDVVKNKRNGSYYRYEHPESNRTRIRPLELFPNGLLIPKSADTIVESNLEVEMMGQWSEEFYVQDESAERLKTSFRAEFVQKREILKVLEAELLTIDPNKHGGRGSHVNKIKAVARRVESLERGLAERSEDVQIANSSADIQSPLWEPKDFVQLPSGLPGIVIDVMDKKHVKIGIKTCAGKVLKQAVDPNLLRPLEYRHLATI